MSSMSSRTTPRRSRSTLGRSMSSMAAEMRPPSQQSSIFKQPQFSSPMARPPSRSSSGSGSGRSTPVPFVPYTGSISVSIRANPDVGSGPSPWRLGDVSIVHKDDGQMFQFDHVFSDLNVTNRQVYVRSCQPLVEKFVADGYNSTIFAYGMTGSGKTWTMKGDAQDPGVVRLAADHIFNHIENDTSGATYELWASYFEIYNERVLDLLNPGHHSDLQIRSDREFGNKIVGLQMPQIHSRDQLLRLIESGDVHRKTGSTDFNARSSRSHSILQLRLKTCDGSEPRFTTLTLCDLAGSEKAALHAERRKEGSFINKSLLALGTVIAKLSANQGEHINYRDSKLTRLLQPSLSGSALVSILCTIHLGSSTPGVVSETHNSLRFAARAKAVEVQVQQQQRRYSSAVDAQVVEELRAQVEAQRREIEQLKEQVPNPFMATNSHSSSPLQGGSQAQLEAENRILNERLEHWIRLNDTRQTEKMLLKNEAINAIIKMDDVPQIAIQSLEEYARRVHHENAENQSYISHLESRLQSALQSPQASSPSLEARIRELEEENQTLKETIKDKNFIINTMSRSTNLRLSMESRDKENVSPIKKRMPLAPTRI
ncbi:hypothetical protein DIURU_005457 [Diutina rugosa]|uniref:Kinesin motor domain-containing protein n=1 Tax=Diutina rugosa TaxID=5481 RepID=A0A642UCZ3_DIURU|nr:uncharacterized protein DIURU_005457 [Diutina rugosa]KAA8896944.1 hypothetical protein DIURU_005457 [Diutina rugosa]